MKALIEKLKPVAKEVSLNFLGGIVAIVALAFTLSLLGAVFGLRTGTVLEIASYIKLLFTGIAAHTIGAFIRKVVGK